MTGQPNQLAETLYRWRTDRSYTLQQAADHLGVSDASWHHWENGKYKPLRKLPLIADLLDIDEVEAFRLLRTPAGNDLRSATGTIPGLLCRLIPNSGRSTTFRRTGTDSVLLSAVPA